MLGTIRKETIERTKHQRGLKNAIQKTKRNDTEQI